MITKAKQELLEDMKQMRFCEKSLTAVSECRSIEDLCHVLRVFKTDLKGVSFPRIEWFRRWFTTDELKQQLALNGVFVDVKMTLCSWMRNVFVYGNSEISIAGNDRRMMFINVFNNAHISIFDNTRFGLYHVELIDKATIDTRKGDYTKIIISDKR